MERLVCCSKSELCRTDECQRRTQKTCRGGWLRAFCSAPLQGSLSGLWGRLGDVTGEVGGDASAGSLRWLPSTFPPVPCVQMLARGGTRRPHTGRGGRGERGRGGMHPAARLPTQVSTGLHEKPPPCTSPSSPPHHTSLSPGDRKPGRAWS